MSTPMLLAQSQLTKTPTKAQTHVTKASKPTEGTAAYSASPQASPVWLMTSGGLALLLVSLGVFSKIQMGKAAKKLRFEEFRTRELQKKLKLALETIRKMETNPDLINSREFNLDYLRLRMAEEVFHFAIVNQIKVKVKDKISQALRPSQAQQGIVGIASAGRQVDETFDVEYETGAVPKRAKRVLFRVQIRLMKLPTQATSVTITQIIDCIETYLSPAEDHDTWQPTIQGRIVHMHWDQNAKPTPLLVIEQSNEGVNVTFRTSREAPGVTPPPPPPTQSSSSQPGKSRTNREALGGKNQSLSTKPASSQPTKPRSRATPPSHQRSANK